MSTCVKAAKIVEDYDPDFLVAVGGGSNIDTTKAVELLLRYPGHDPYDVLFGDVAPSGPPRKSSAPGAWAIPMTTRKSPLSR